MFDFGFNEFVLLSILIVILFGPKELPVIIRALHRFFSQMWVYSKEIRTYIESLVNEADISNQNDLKEIEKEINNITKEIEDK